MMICCLKRTQTLVSCLLERSAWRTRLQCKNLILRRCRDNLVKLHDYQLQGIMVKLGKAKNPKGVTTYVIETRDKI
jgi:hypothetical protein